MDANQVRALAAAGESLTVEFKSDRARLSDGHLVEAVACMANGPGGVVLLGVEDDGTITGTKPRHSPSTKAPLVQALISNTTVPPLSTTVTIVPVDGHEVIAIEVEQARTPIGTSRGVYTRRAIKTDGGPECVPYAFHEMFGRAVEVGQTDHARLPARGATWDDLDPLEFERLRSLTAAGGDTTLTNLEDVDIARALGVLGPDGDVLLGALLLFGSHAALADHIPGHESQFQVLRGTAVETNVSTHAPLLATAQDLYARIEAYNREEEVDSGLIRIAVPLISPTAVREALANALVHRDYARLGAVQLQLDGDAFTVTSPGGFPEGITTANFLRTNRPRSPLLAEAFKRAGLVERSGRGINRMFETTIRLGRQAPDYSQTTNSSVVATFGLGHADLELARFVSERERAGGSPFTLADLQVLSRLRQGGSLRLVDASEMLQKTENETRIAFARMSASGLVEQRGSGRGTRYHLSASVYRALGDRAAYVRVHGFSHLQAESMVLAFVAAHRQITRSEAADLCSLTPAQASTLLRRLAKEGRLTMHGERRGALYRLPDETEDPPRPNSNV
ncbi:putative DNA binding domain-containing protein [Actinotalea sp. BY-33]|uniref:DNA binding domain-containing protein n=1 Tax=Actinotalea soli TaxID=2819234 RepID=A0A939LPD6_9CELL|nr:crosslink repair DNA glycosylase YcaQ family protein [Actinotalea soli]MBO1751424.1 putative DNA binding domain-containing protein [Actinotalea soli]